MERSLNSPRGLASYSRSVANSPQTVPELSVERRRIRKFLLRSETALNGPIASLPQDEEGNLEMTLTWERTDGGPWRATRLDRPMLGKRDLDSVIMDCRVFFTVREDCYLPGVVKALQRLHTRERAIARRKLGQVVGVMVDGNKLRVQPGRASMYSGRIEADNGLGPGKLLGSDQIAMDYINGIAAHEDEASLARLQNLPNDESMRHAVTLAMADLLQVVGYVRRQIDHDLGEGYISLDDVPRSPQ
jgi:hypothetical protein